MRPLSNIQLMDNPILNVFICKGKSIRIQRVNSLFFTMDMLSYYVLFYKGAYRM